MIDPNNERETIQILMRQAEATVEFFSQKMKWEREKAVCKALLRGLKIQFRDEEIKKPSSDPPDVMFRSAQFEVREILDLNRQRHSEWKATLEQRKRASSIEDLLEPYRNPEPMDWLSAVELVTRALESKAAKYGCSACGRTDALVYLNLCDHFVDSATPIPSMTSLSKQEWRSVSLVTDTFCVVLVARETAPEFLRSVTGITFGSHYNLFEEENV